MIRRRILRCPNFSALEMSPQKSMANTQLYRCTSAESAIFTWQTNLFNLLMILKPATVKILLNHWQQYNMPRENKKEQSYLTSRGNKYPIVSR